MAEVDLSRPSAADLAISAMACSRRHTFESVVNWGTDGNGRRSAPDRLLRPECCLGGEESR
jgi:hypothetical protein